MGHLLQEENAELMDIDADRLVDLVVRQLKHSLLITSLCFSKIRDKNHQFK